MNIIYNRGRENPRRPGEYKSKRELMPVRTIVSNENDFDFNLRTMRTEGDYQSYVTTLKQALKLEEITNDEFDDYISEGTKKYAKILNQTKKKEIHKNKSEEHEEAKVDTSSESYGDSSTSDSIKKEDKMKVRGERNIDEEMLAKKEEERIRKVNKFKAFSEFMKTPIARVLIFIVMGVFLLIYLTKSSMSDVLSSPIIIVLVIVFMLIVLGRGGKSRHHSYEDVQNSY